MSVAEIRQIIETLEKENNPANADLIAFYKRKVNEAVISTLNGMFENTINTSEI